MNLYDLIEDAKVNGRASHDLREHCALNFLEVFAAYKQLVQCARDNGCMFMFYENHDARIQKMENVKT